MVQRKVPNKLGIKPYDLISDTHLVSLRPLSPQSHDLKKIMKKPRPVKRVDESRSLSPPFKKKKMQPVHDDGARSTPNYMKSTSSFEARKEQSPKSATPKVARKLKTDDPASENKGSRTSSLKKVTTLTKTTSFKPLRPLKKVILCEDLDAQRATCSSTLKEAKFPDYLQLDHGGTESEGTSAMKVCPYTYCSLNGHHHAPLPPLTCFLSAKRRALKTQKNFKVGCLSPRQRTPVVKKDDIKEPEIAAKETQEEENRDFFVEIYSKDREEKGNQDLECSDMDWEEGYCSALFSDDGGDFCKEKNQKTGDDRLYSELQQLYDEETVTSGAWSDEDGDSELDSSYLKDHEFQNYDESDVSSTTTESDVNDKMDEIQGLDLLSGENNIECSIEYQQKETSQELKIVPDFAEKTEDGNNKNHTTIIYNIIQYNISIYVNGEKTEHSEPDKGVNVHVPLTSVAANEKETEEINEVMEEKSMSNEDDDAENLTAFDEASEVNQMVADEEVPVNGTAIESIDFVDNAVTEIDEPESKSDEEQKHLTDIKTASSSKQDNLSELEDSSVNLRGFTRGKRSDQEMDDDSNEFNPHGPNFLPEVPDPDAETVDLKHQTMDERKNAEEWMVDFALRQAVTTLAPARKKRVSLLVEAFEKVLPIPKYEAQKRPTSKAFTNTRQMQACS